MKTWADFHEFCNADVPGVSTITAERELRRAAQHFCAQTKVWKEDLDPAYIFPGIDIYDVDAPPKTTIVKITQISLNGYPIFLNAAEPQTNSGVEFLSPVRFRIQPKPVARAKLAIAAVLQPAHDATGIADELFMLYAEVIGMGAKAKLYAQPQKSYSNAAQAVYERESFDSAIARIKITAAKAYSGAPLRTRPSFF